jgi:hypothetical protein
VGPAFQRVVGQPFQEEIMHPTKNVAAAVALSVAGLFAVSSAAHAGAYPTNTCVSSKQKAASKFCSAAAKAWSKYHAAPGADPGGTARDTAIGSARNALDTAWVKAEDKATKMGVDCAVTTVDGSTAGTDIETALNTLQATVTASLDTAGSTDDAKCASKILGAAGKLCAGLLKSEAKHMKALAKDPNGDILDAGIQKSLDKFNSLYTKAAATCAGTPATALDIVSNVDGTSDAVVFNTTTSPNLPTVMTEIPFNVGDTIDYKGETLSPICAKGTPYSYWYRRGTVNKLLMYYQGGGACWDNTSCWIANTFKNFARERVCVLGSNPGTNCTLNGDAACTGGGTCGPYFSTDNPDLVGTGFANSSDPNNPFKDWHVVFVTYCTGDVHWGNAFGAYGPGQGIEHRGRINAMVAEKFAREHFPNPEEVFVTGSSAGSYGALLNSAFLMGEVYPASKFNVLGDAGIGVITKGWLDASFGNWGVDGTLPRFVTGLDVPANTLAMPDVIAALANHFPQHHFASYQSAYDGSGGGQSAFFNVMRNPGDVLQWPKWWQNTCDWNACMRQFVETIDANTSNFRYFTGAGSAHTGFGFDKIYEDTTGGMPKLVDWINDMRAGAPAWTSQHCGGTGVGAGCDLVDTCQGGGNAGLPCTSDVDCPGGSCYFDPTPNPLAAPYEPGGIVNCPVSACPCGAGASDVVCGNLP